MNTGSELDRKKSIDPNIKKLEEDLGEKLGAKVIIQHTEKGKGRLVINYNSLDELDGILVHLEQRNFPPALRNCFWARLILHSKAPIMRVLFSSLL